MCFWHFTQCTRQLSSHNHTHAGKPNIGGEGGGSLGDGLLVFLLLLLLLLRLLHLGLLQVVLLDELLHLLLLQHLDARLAVLPGQRRDLHYKQIDVKMDCVHTALSLTAAPQSAL